MESFESLFRKTYRAAHKMAFDIIHDRNAAQDIVQNAAMYIVEKKPEGVTRSYWLQLVTSRAKDALRTKKAHRKGVASGALYDLAEIEHDVIHRNMKKRKGG